jgi:hypothetical protein
VVGRVPPESQATGGLEGPGTHEECWGQGDR